MSLTKKFVFRRALLALGTAAMLPMAVSAQTAWPTKAVKIVVPFTPGGSNDIIARLLATHLTNRLGQPVVIENKPGAGGTIGTEFVAKAVPDGHTFLFASTSITTNAAFGKKLSYDTEKDLTPIGRIASTPFAVVVGTGVKATTLKDFIKLAAATPGSINYGTAGIGGINHLGTELLASAANIELTHVPYKGIGPAFNDLMGGKIEMLLPSLASVLPHIQGGKMRGLAVTSAQRSPLAPNIPTVSESGVPGFQLEAWFGLLGPARLPAPVVKRMNEELNFVLNMQEVKSVLAKEAATPLPGAPEELGKLIGLELSRWSKLIKAKNIVMD